MQKKIFKLGQASKGARFGNLKTGFFEYVTPTMIATVVLVLVLIFMNQDQLVENFNTNVMLNSLIFLIIFIAIGLSTINNINLMHAVRFFSEIEAHMDSGKTGEEDIRELQNILESRAFLVNTKRSFTLLDNLKHYNHPLVSDTDARLIKSKLGFRMRSARSRVSFLAGLLVMLGLIGTFWGLLITIGAVGEALNSISVSGSDAGSMGGIISAISKPLDGMGLAFSTSLFGLSGSLLVGFYNYVCSSAQDMAIEDMSRWIDDHIPEPGKMETEKGQVLKTAGEGKDLEAWLASFAYLSHRTERKLGDVFMALSRSTESTLRLLQHTQSISQTQLEIKRGIFKGNERLEKLQVAGESLLERTGPLADTVRLLSDRVETLDATIHGNTEQSSRFGSNIVSLKENLDMRLTQFIGDLQYMKEKADSSNAALPEIQAVLGRIDKNLATTKEVWTSELERLAPLLSETLATDKHVLDLQTAQKDLYESSMKIQHAIANRLESLASDLSAYMQGRLGRQDYGQEIAQNVESLHQMIGGFGGSAAKYKKDIEAALSTFSENIRQDKDNDLFIRQIQNLAEAIHQLKERQEALADRLEDFSQLMAPEARLKGAEFESVLHQMRLLAEELHQQVYVILPESKPMPPWDDK